MTTDRVRVVRVIVLEGERAWVDAVLSRSRSFLQPDAPPVQHAGGSMREVVRVQENIAPVAQLGVCDRSPVATHERTGDCENWRAV